MAATTPTSASTAGAANEQTAAAILHEEHQQELPSGAAHSAAAAARSDSDIASAGAGAGAGIPRGYHVSADADGSTGVVRGGRDKAAAREANATATHVGDDSSDTDGEGDPRAGIVACVSFAMSCDTVRDMLPSSLEGALQTLLHSH